MKKASEYHEHAEECRQLASRSIDPEHKAALIKMAETWENLAKERMALLERKERIAALEVPSTDQ